MSDSEKAIKFRNLQENNESSTTLQMSVCITELNRMLAENIRQSNMQNFHCDHNSDGHSFYLTGYHEHHKINQKDC